MMLTDLNAFKERGPDIQIYPLAKVLYPERISLGDHIIIDDFVLIIPGEAGRIGNYVHIASFTSITGGGVFILEDFSAIATGTRLLTGTDDFVGAALTNPTAPMEYRNVTRSVVRLQKHALVGANVVVLPGVTIGEGATVGAGSVVTRDLEPWTVNVGIPARPIKERPRDGILRLERELKEKYGWWQPRRRSA
jgi:galactoside O-acetyltransferase